MKNGESPRVSMKLENKNSITNSIIVLSITIEGKYILVILVTGFTVYLYFSLAVRKSFLLPNTEDLQSLRPSLSFIISINIYGTWKWTNLIRYRLHGSRYNIHNFLSQFEIFHVPSSGTWNDQVCKIKPILQTVFSD